MVVYLLTNMVNNKKYVGRTVHDNLNRYLSVKRWQAKRGLTRNMPIVSAIAKYGWQSFDVTVLCRVSDVTLLDILERQWIEDLDTRNPDKGYNICEGGGTGRTGVKNSAEHNRLIGLANKGRKPVGYVRTEENRQQLRDRMKGNKIGVKITSDTTKRWSNSLTPEQRSERARKAAKARWNKEV